jgi:hypothetical protein
MYNKLFTKILDSSIWLAPTDTRVVWITFLAAMDEDGIVRLATVGNVAARARVSIEAAKAAIEALESPEPESVGCPYEGRRIERVPGGWLVLKSNDYKEMVTKHAVREMTRARVSRYREKKSRNADVTPTVTRNVSVTQSDTDTDTDTDTDISLPSGESGVITPSLPEKEGKQGGSQPKPSRKRRAALSHFVPDDFQVSQELYDWAIQEGYTPDQLRRESELFADHEFKSPRSDWNRAWQNWIRKSAPGDRYGSPKKRTA